MRVWPWRAARCRAVFPEGSCPSIKSSSTFSAAISSVSSPRSAALSKNPEYFPLGFLPISLEWKGAFAEPLPPGCFETRLATTSASLPSISGTQQLFILSTPLVNPFSQRCILAVCPRDFRKMKKLSKGQCSLPDNFFLESPVTAPSDKPTTALPSATGQSPPWHHGNGPNTTASPLSFARRCTTRMVTVTRARHSSRPRAGRSTDIRIECFAVYTLRCLYNARITRTNLRYQNR